MKDVPDHLSVLKDVDGLIFLSNTKHLNEFLHPGGYLSLVILNNTNQILSNNIYNDNRVSGCVYPLVNFVLD